MENVANLRTLVDIKNTFYCVCCQQRHILAKESFDTDKRHIRGRKELCSISEVSSTDSQTN